jgi:mRNA degradation ribonuclease J1/J2
VIPAAGVPPLDVIPLGGLGEFGMNMMVVACGGTAILIDAGVMFPEPELLGVDLVIPDLRQLQQYDIAAIVLTHGHEDHIGAQSWHEQEIPDRHLKSVHWHREDHAIAVRHCTNLDEDASVRSAFRVEDEDVDEERETPYERMKEFSVAPVANDPDLHGDACASRGTCRPGS